MQGKSKFQISRSLDERIKRIINGSNEFDTEFSQVSSAFILGFHYGNVTNCVGLTTNYQLQHAVFPVVGMVFFKTSPSDDEIKQNLMLVKEVSSAPNGLGSFKMDKNEHLFLIYSVDRNKEIEKRIFNFSKCTFVRRRRLRLNILNDPYCPRQIYRGSEDILGLGDGDSVSSNDDDHVDHLIFFVHGVGGVCDVRFRPCTEVVADFKKMANHLLSQVSNPSSGASTPASNNSNLSQHFRKGLFRRASESQSNSELSADAIPSPLVPEVKNRRVECLPVNWHSCTRKQTGMNDQLNLTALGSVPKLRHLLNKVVMDALLYSSGPVYSQTIVNNVGDEINRLYGLFLEKHPNFSGSVSLAGHSLGSIILFDILAHQKVIGQPGAIESNAKSSNSLPRCTPCNHVAHHHHLYNSTSSAQTADCTNYRNIDELLKDMNLTQYTELFKKEHIDINTLLLLTDLDMKELNLPFGVRRRLGTYINFKKVSNAFKAPEARNVASNNQLYGNKEDTEAGANKNETIVTPCESNSKHLEGNIDQVETMISTEDNNNYSVIHDVGQSCECSNTGQYLIKYPQLKFKPRCFFAFGSPMSMFFSVRGVQDLNRDYKFPTCDRMLNIFHPYDPLAYRLEPLIDPRFKDIEPIQIPHHRGGKRIHVQLREGFARVGHDFKHRFLGSLRDTWSTLTRFTTSASPSPPPESSSGIPGKYSPTIDEHPSGSNKSSRSKASSKRQLTKSTSSSIEMEVQSLEGSMSFLSKQQKRLLKRQESIVSHADPGVNVSSLDSIIEGTVKRHSKNELKSYQTETPRTKTSDEPHDDQAKGLVEAPGGESVHQDDQEEDKFHDEAQERLSSSASNELDTNKVGNLNGGRRLDYVLQEKPIELFNEYIFAFTSHANYWQNEDSALILLNELYQCDGIHLFDNFE